MNHRQDLAIAVRPARPHEASLLSGLALRSKAHWGYSADFIDACRAELTYDTADIANRPYDFVVAEVQNTIVGFYALAESAGADFEVDALFVEPTWIGKSVGRRLLAHAGRAARDRGAMRLIIQADPNALRFYEAAGARPIGTRASASIPGRELPLLAIDLIVR